MKIWVRVPKSENYSFGRSVNSGWLKDVRCMCVCVCVLLMWVIWKYDSIGVSVKMIESYEQMRASSVDTWDIYTISKPMVPINSRWFIMFTDIFHNFSLSLSLLVCLSCDPLLSLHIHSILLCKHLIHYAAFVHFNHFSLYFFFAIAAAAAVAFICSNVRLFTSSLYSFTPPPKSERKKKKREREKL